MFRIYGTVKDENGQPLQRLVRALDRTTFRVMNSTYSSALTGEYRLDVPTDEPCIVACQPSDEEVGNMYVYDLVTPVDGSIPNTGINQIGVPGTLGFGVGICPEDLSDIGISPMDGTDNINSENYGNYTVDVDGSVMVWIPAFWYKWGTGSNGLGLNEIDIINFDEYVDEATANADGYAIHRAFYDGGVIKSGVFVDKYTNSKHPTLNMTSSIKLGSVISSGHLTALDGIGTMSLWGLIPASKLRGYDYFCTSRFIYAALVFLSYAHGQASLTTEFCGWYNISYNFPKGTTQSNGYNLYDGEISSLASPTQGYRAGSAFPTERITHNGQLSGVTDVCGNRYEFSPGFSYESSQFRVLKTSVAMKDVTGGTTLATDLWGSSGLLQYDEATNTFGAMDGTTSYRYLDPTVQTFSEATSGLDWQMTGLGLPLAGALSTTNYNHYGGALESRRTTQSAPFTCGHWNDGGAAGVFSLLLSQSRSNQPSTGPHGFRLSAYVP